METLEGLIEFKAVAENGTFSDGARLLGVSVSHVSRQIARLEARLGTRLFARTTRQMHLTPAGARLFHTAQPLLQDLIQAQDALLASHDAIEGSIRVSLAGQFAQDTLVPIFLDFAQRHPAVRLELDISARNVDLVTEGFDLAIRMGPLQSSASLVAIRLVSIPSVVLVNPALLSQLPSISTPRDLPPDLCLSLVSRTWEFSRGKQRTSIKPRGRISTNSGVAAVRAAHAGLGIINVPIYYWTEGDERLVDILSDWTSRDARTFYMVYPANRHLPVRIRRLVEWLQTSIGSATFKRRE